MMSGNEEQYLTVNGDNNISNGNAFQALDLGQENLHPDTKKNIPLSDHLDESHPQSCHTAFPVDLKEVFELTNPSEEIHQTLIRPPNDISTPNTTYPSSQLPQSPKESPHIASTNQPQTWAHVLNEQPNHVDDINNGVVVNQIVDCTPVSPRNPGMRDASCQVDDIPSSDNDLKFETDQVQQTKSNNQPVCCINTSSGLHEVPQSLLNLTIVTETPENPAPQVVVHNGIRPELYTQERHLVVEAGTKAQASPRHNGTYPCNHCGKIFADSRSLQRHILIHVGLRPYRCPVCGKAFMLNGDLTRHIRIHSGERPYACEVCGRRFTLKGNLMQHFRTHAPEKQYACTICERNYAQKDSLHRHIRAHFGEKPFECSACGKRFTLKGDLSRHSLIHSGLKPHICKFCGRQFALKGNLTQHIRTHVKTKTNHTDAIPKNQTEPQMIHDLTYSHIQKTLTAMPNNSDLVKLPAVNDVSASNHSTSIISSSNPYVQTSSSNDSNHQPLSAGLSFCSECSKTFSSPENLHEHVQLIHEQSTRLATNRYLCNICQKEFCLKGDLTRHLNSHNGIKPYECEHCNKTFTLKSNLRQHLTTHRMDKNFSCPMCGKPFGNRRNLNLHLRRHEQARANFTCTKCGRSFLAKSDHFFHNCVKEETSSPLPETSNHVSIPLSSISTTLSSSPTNTLCHTSVSSEVTAEVSLPSVVVTDAFPVKRELCQLSCNTRDINMHPETTSPNNATINGIQCFPGPFYRHLYFSTSHQTILPNLKGLLHSPSADVSLSDYNRVAKTS